MNDTGSESLRIDKWLWFTRFYRTRGLAASAVGGGHVKLNGQRAKTSAGVKIGDSIHLVREQSSWSLRVLALPARRGPAAEARLCYEEDALVRERREQLIADRRADRLQMPQTDGKPDKHTRRQLRARRRPV
jgi:ribosome-associated heat shock protein Hsp15